MVEVIHTNGGACGIKNKVGHLDFYVNGGETQNGFTDSICHPFNFCSHGLAFDFYIESINCEKCFYGHLCENANKISEKDCKGPLIKMGGIRVNEETHKFDFPNVKEGNFYVKTAFRSPYDLGKDF